MVQTVLVVDDDKTHRMVLERLLRREGYNVATAIDGQNALEEFDRCRPRLVLLDVQMPRLDGFQVCRRIKSRPESSSVPIVLISGLPAREARHQSFQAGADDFLSKPFEACELLGRVHSLINGPGIEHSTSF